jgi:hypothetical protein
MLISQKIENVFPVAATSDNAVRTENPEPLRDNGNRLTLELCQFGDAGLSLGEPGEEANPRRLAKGTKDPSRTLNCGLVYRNMKAL